MRIGNIELPRTAMLAPMAGVADRAYREICRRLGACACVSEMVSVKGLVYGANGTERLCTITPPERPMGIQLFGSDPAFAARATELVQAYAPDWIDWNMGCPVHKVTADGAGSALMKDPALAAQIVRASVAHSSVPVTVKMRIGWDEQSVNAVPFAQAMEAAGAAAIAVHGRTKSQLYSGEANWGVIAQVRQAVHIPVIASGDVRSRTDCAALYARTGCDLVMVGRGSYGNPFLFRQITDPAAPPPTLAEKMEMMLTHVRLLLAYSEKPPEIAIREARKLAAWYMTGLHGAAQLRARCYSLGSLTQLEEMAAQILRENI